MVIYSARFMARLHLQIESIPPTTGNICKPFHGFSAFMYIFAQIRFKGVSKGISKRFVRHTGGRNRNKINKNQSLKIQKRTE